MRGGNRIFAVLLALVMILPLAACSGNQSPENEVTTAAPDQTASVEETTESTDYKDITIKAMLWIPYTGEGEYPAWATHFKPIYEAIDEFEQSTGAKVEIVGENNSSMLAAAQAAGESYDLAFQYAYFPSYANVGLAQPLDDILDLNDPVYSRNFSDAHKYKGKVYAVQNEKMLEYECIWYNDNLFAGSNVKTPYEYYKEGNWTWDSFVEAAKAITKDTNSDGENDIFGVGMWALGHMITSNGARVYEFAEDGKLIPKIDSQNSMELFQFIYDLCQTHKVVNGGNGREEFAKGVVGMKIDGGSFMPGYDTVGIGKLENGDIIKRAPLPKGPSAGDEYATSNVNDQGWFIPNGAKNTKASSELLHLILTRMAESVDKYEWNAEDKEMVDAILIKMAYSTTYNVDGVANIPSVFWDDWAGEYVRMFNEPAATVMAKAKEQNVQQCEAYNKKFVY